MRTALIIAALMFAEPALAACDSPASDQDLAGTRDAAVRPLKDPDSLVFRDACRIPADNGSVFVCGLANAKNSMGGYVGYRRFVFLVGSDSFHFDPGPESPQSASFEAIHCAACLGEPMQSCVDRARIVEPDSPSLVP